MLTECMSLHCAFNYVGPMLNILLQGGIESSINESSLLLMGEDDTLLLERLKLKSTEDFDPVPPQLLRKYIGYARKYVHPILSEEAADVLQV